MRTAGLKMLFFRLHIACAFALACHAFSLGARYPKDTKQHAGSIEERREGSQGRVDGQADGGYFYLTITRTKVSFSKASFGA